MADSTAVAAALDVGAALAGQAEMWKREAFKQQHVADVLRARVTQLEAGIREARAILDEDYRDTGTRAVDALDILDTLTPEAPVTADADSDGRKPTP
jgi:hypothetical protein